MNIEVIKNDSGIILKNVPLAKAGVIHYGDKSVLRDEKYLTSLANQINGQAVTIGHPAENKKMVSVENANKEIKGSIYDGKVQDGILFGSIATKDEAVVEILELTLQQNKPFNVSIGAEKIQAQNIDGVYENKKYNTQYIDGKLNHVAIFVEEPRDPNASGYLTATDSADNDSIQENHSFIINNMSDEKKPEVKTAANTTPPVEQKPTQKADEEKPAESELKTVKQELDAKIQENEDLKKQLANQNTIATDSVNNVEALSKKLAELENKSKIKDLIGQMQKYEIATDSIKEDATFEANLVLAKDLITKECAKYPEEGKKAASISLDSNDIFSTLKAINAFKGDKPVYHFNGSKQPGNTKEVILASKNVNYAQSQKTK